MESKTFDVENVTRLVKVPLTVEGQASGLSVMLVEDGHGTRSFWYENEEGEAVIPKYTDEEWALFDELVVHVGWDE